MSEVVTFTLDGKSVTASEDETIWQVAKREGVGIPHLCHKDAPGYRSDGNCRACMVDIEGERTLTASCIRHPAEGMVVNTETERATKAREMVFELLMADQPDRHAHPDPESDFWRWSDNIGVTASRYAPCERPAQDVSHPAIAVNLEACIACNLCERACREVQVNDVIGMGWRGSHAAPVFDLADPMGLSSCVACGECVSACPTGALFEKSLMDETAATRTVYPDETVDSVCPFCGVGCLTSVSVSDGKIVKVEGRDGPANENRLCVKGRFGFDYVSSPERLTKPLVRREDAPKDPELKLNPSNYLTVFREASWEEALHRAADGLKESYGAKGGAGLAGFGSAKGSNEEAYLFQKFIRQGFGTNNVDHCTRLCHASSVAALMEGIGSGAVTAPFSSALDADCIIVIGARPEQNHPVAATYLKQAAQRGAKLVVMDPRHQGLMRFADYALVFKPGSDVAMLNAILNVIITEGLYDSQYIAAHVDGFEALKEKIADFTPEAMEPVCGIDAETLREVARLYAKSGKSIIFWGMGVSQHVHGTDNVRCLIAMALTTGHIGRPGTGLHPLRGQNNVQGASDAGLIPQVFPDYRSVEDPAILAEFEDAWGRTLDPQRGLTVVEIMDDILAGGIEAMYVMGENPAMSDPDQHHARKALTSLKHLVVQDIFLTETAWHADVILPATAHAEKLGTFTNTNRQVQIGRPCVSAPGEARPDLDLIIELANRVGLNWDYSGVPEVYEEMRSHMRSLEHISWDRLERDGTVTYPADDDHAPGNEILFGQSFPTSDGRARIVPTDLVPPAELPDADFPLVLTTGRMLEHWHTGAMTRRATVLDAIEPEPVVSMHPKEIRKAGLEVGQQVRVETRRGTITLTLRADRDVSTGMLFIPFCFQEAPANFLTNPQLDPFGKIPEFKYCAARIAPAMLEAAE
ncbi:formate dehydrogenase subunit alpha [Roseibium polysiphoniae]|uniref:Formate dehydrogenase subunit alpha n=1 Tax=Roseibium polysiphoniae TaxID=2571221 RepID=A0ABR9CFU4_9HYPH|nr:formate dehydrogenase subunit alpha [Roseibium polysiphoniae]MBD8878449.1 formate dehydrogenase subunit alpha [Roseibium polysiphoniae]